MIKRIIEFSLDNRFIVFVLIAAIVVSGIWAIRGTPLDAIPDLSDVQVIVLTEFPGQAPRIVEDQVTYPITTKMLSAPGARVVRGFSFYNYSFVYIIFEDGTDPYWARSRVLEYLSQLQSSLPAGVTPQLGPDATGVGWAFMYVLTSDRRDIAQLRSLQDWHLKYELAGLPDVAEVASMGGAERQYQVTVDPEKMRAYEVTINQVRMAIERSNNEVGGRSIEMAESEFILRGMGYLGSLTREEARAAEASGVMLDVARMNRTVEELEAVALGVRDDGTPIILRDVANVGVGPEMRRGIVDWNGEGETAGGIVVVRYGADVLKTIERVKAKLAELEQSLPDDVEVHVAYDRTALIGRAIENLVQTLVEVSVAVAFVIILFLFHFRSALVPILTLPLAILASFVIMRWQGIGANIMSLAGIAIAIGAMVDASIVIVENIHKKMEEDEGRTPHWQLIREASVEVGPTLFYALLVITISFMPIFTLEAQEGRLFKPLAFTKTYAMGAAAFLAITVSPVLAGLFVRRRVMPERWSRIRRAALLILLPIALGGLVLVIEFRFGVLTSPFWLGWPAGHWLALVVALVAFLALLPQRIHPEESNPVNRGLIAIYHPALIGALAHRRRGWFLIAAAVVIMASVVWPATRLGSEFIPPLYEGDLLYMPTTLPGLSVTKAREILQQTDKIIASFPEVDRVLGKVGRADSATDPAPMEMIETTISLKPDSEWPEVDILDATGEVIAHRRRTPDELIEALDREIKFPGLTNAWTMPIRTRIDMRSTGIKTPGGIKFGGEDLEVLQRVGEQVEAVMRSIPNTRSAYAERASGGNYINFIPDRRAIQRHGLTVGDIQDVFMTAIGGMMVTQTVEGLERYSVNLRYPRELRDNLDALRQVLVPTASGAQVPMSQLGSFEIESGPMGIKSEQSRPNAWVYVDVEDIDVGTYVDNARQVVADAIREGRIELPAGYTLTWSGQYEYIERAKSRLALVVPLTLAIVMLLIYLNTGSLFKTGVVMLAVPFSLVGAIWALYWLDYNMSVAVWVGLIALAGVDAETGQVMMLYLDLSVDEAERKGKLGTLAELRDAIYHGAVQRIRPKAMTVATDFIGLMPIMWSAGTGADVTRRIAVPLIAGMFTSFIMELMIYPVIYYLWRGRGMRENRATEAGA